MKMTICLLLIALLASADVLFGQSAVQSWQAMAPAGGTSSSAGTTLLFSAGQPVIGLTDSGTINLASGSIPLVRLLNGTTAFSSSFTEQGWNMVSVPLVVSDYRKTSLYPTAISVAFAFSSNAYVVRDTLQNGVGYWLKFGAVDTLHSPGTALTHDTIDVQQGWNMIGTIQYPISVSDITPVPPVAILGSFYGFSSAAGYSPADTLSSSKAYWVKVSDTGRLVLNSGSVLDDPASRILIAGGPTRRLASKSAKADEEIRVLSVKDARGAKRDLRFSSKQTDVESDALELPPTPPAGVFDIRFASQRAVAFVTQQSGAEEFPILINGAVYPITITWEDIPADQDVVLIFTHVGKAAEQHPLRSKGSFVITDNRFIGIKLALKVRETPNLPKFFALHQNYPNPFNPSTMLNYQLPVNGYATLKVYNLLGQEVATLVNEVQEAGFKSVEWDAGGFASGVYVYRLEAGGSVYTKKMLLLR